MDRNSESGVTLDCWRCVKWGRRDEHTRSWWASLAFVSRVEVRGWRTHSHAQQPSGIMLQLEVLVFEGLGPVDTGAAGAVTEDEVAALDHEVFDLM